MHKKRNQIFMHKVIKLQSSKKGDNLKIYRRFIFFLLIMLKIWRQKMQSISYTLIGYVSFDVPEWTHLKNIYFPVV